MKCVLREINYVIINLIVPGRGNNRYKGPEIGIYFGIPPRDSMEAEVIEMQQAMGRMVKVQKKSKYQVI